MVFSLIVVAAVMAPTPGTIITRGSLPWLEYPAGSRDLFASKYAP